MAKNIIFAHANGFPPAAYKSLLSQFEAYNISPIAFRPLHLNSKPEELKSWNLFKDELISHIRDSKLETPLHAIGHSMGANSIILAAIERPELFRSITLIEPVMLPKWIFKTVRLLPYFIRKKIIPPSKVAFKRTDTFSNKDAVFSYYRAKPVFKKISDTILWDYINAAFIPTQKGEVTLRYTKEWEGRIYNYVANLWPLLPKIKCPLLIMRAQHSDAFFDNEWRLVQREVPNAQFTYYPNNGHLVPFEAPQQVGQDILSFLSNPQSISPQARM